MRDPEKLIERLTYDIRDWTRQAEKEEAEPVNCAAYCRGRLAQAKAILEFVTGGDSDKMDSVSA